MSRNIGKKIQGKTMAWYTEAMDTMRAVYKRFLLKNTDFSIISKNCVGGMISERMHLPFRSPTAGLSIPSPDFIRMCENLPYYMSLTPVEIKDDSVKWPVGMIGDVRLDFIHYPTFETACEKWERRKKRINYDNLFFIMTEREDCSDELRQRFEALPYKHKIWFTHLPCENQYIYIYINTYPVTKKRVWGICWTIPEYCGAMFLRRILIM